MSDIERAIRHYLTGRDDVQGLIREEARSALRSHLGEAVFSQRRPSNAHTYQVDGFGATDLAVTLETTRVIREYLLTNEFDDVQKEIEITVLARGNRASLITRRVAEYIRLALTNFTGTMSYRDDRSEVVTMYLCGCTIENEGSLPPIPSRDGQDRWTARYFTRYRIIHKQQIPEAV